MSVLEFVPGLVTNFNDARVANCYIVVKLDSQYCSWIRVKGCIPGFEYRSWSQSAQGLHISELLAVSRTQMLMAQDFSN